MKLSAHSMTRLALVALLSFALALPTSAGAQPATGSVSAVLVSDDNIPGVALPESPVVGTLVVLLDKDDVFNVHLDAGDTVSARLTGAPGTEFILALYGPGATDVFAETPLPLAESYEDSYPSFLSNATDGTLSFTAVTSGTYYLDVYTVKGSGAYTVDFAEGVRPTVNLRNTHYINFGKSTVMNGSVLAATGAGLADQRVELFALAYPYTGAITLVGSRVTAIGGAFSFTVKPTRNTRYYAVASVDMDGYSFGDSAVRTVGVKPILTIPKRSKTIYKKRSFTTWGYIKPVHTKGAHTVYVQAWYKKPGATKYKFVKSIKTTNYVTKKYPSYTKYYTKTASLPYKGRWKLVAKAKDDGVHSTAYSRALYVKVK